mmetsp:Transcript_13732/g.24325  ORF Transcript_13732/g.24325 Transcript_13732/m.24325 type:complete len:95 (-) Transcript_13732:374-658(-)
MYGTIVNATIGALAAAFYGSATGVAVVGLMLDVLRRGVDPKMQPGHIMAVGVDPNVLSGIFIQDPQHTLRDDPPKLLDLFPGSVAKKSRQGAIS